MDPLGGSWFVEALTNRVERDVWRYLDEIDRRGGMVAAIADGYPQREIADAAYRFQREFDEGERVIVGVNGYRNDEPVTVPVLAVPEGSMERHLARLARDAGEPRRRGGRGGARGPARGGIAARLERVEPDAALPPLRRGVRDAGRAVPRPARGLRGVPGARLGLSG